jgi:DNA-binding GntR family transcriptional regulator
MNENTFLRLSNRDMLATKVVNILRNQILNGEYKPNERLVQASIAEQLGVSRMPIREALKKLEAEGLVSIEPHRGAVVNSVSIEDIKEIYALRSELEKMAASLSVSRLTELDIKELQHKFKEMGEADNVDDFVAANIEFHRLIIKRCPWKRLLSFIDTLWNGFPQHTPHLLPKQMEKSNEEHKEILNAITKKDSEKASILLAMHIERTGDSLLKKLQENA